MINLTRHIDNLKVVRRKAKLNIVSCSIMFSNTKMGKFNEFFFKLGNYGLLVIYTIIYELICIWLIVMMLILGENWVNKHFE